MTRPAADIERVLALSTEGCNKCEVSRRTGIPRGTVSGWLNGRLPVRAGSDDHGVQCSGCEIGLDLLESKFSDYSYLLGIYLGDGCISSHRRGVFRLRVILDRKYPEIVDECSCAIASITPFNHVSVYRHRHENVDEVSAFSKRWPCLLPQHGHGLKHHRKIELTPWQREIVDRDPWRFLRGLIHSDGLFCQTCDAVGVSWRQNNRYEVSVARRESVALMDLHIGPKR